MLAMGHQEARLIFDQAIAASMLAATSMFVAAQVLSPVAMSRSPVAEARLAPGVPSTSRAAAAAQ